MQNVDNMTLSPDINVAVGYPVQDLHFVQPPPPSFSGEVSVRHIKTFIVLVFILSCVQSSFLFLCAMYLQEISRAWK
jgi:hypothetical protein